VEKGDLMDGLLHLLHESHLVSLFVTNLQESRRSQKSDTRSTNRYYLELTCKRGRRRGEERLMNDLLHLSHQSQQVSLIGTYLQERLAERKERRKSHQLALFGTNLLARPATCRRAIIGRSPPPPHIRAT
jgi:hypothetical protein